MNRCNLHLFLCLAEPGSMFPSFNEVILAALSTLFDLNVLCLHSRQFVLDGLQRDIMQPYTGHV